LFLRRVFAQATPAMVIAYAAFGGRFGSSAA